MKKILIFAAILSMTLTAMAQQGTGWQRIRAKQNFVDSVAIGKDMNITGTMRIQGIAITSDAGEINALDGILVTSTQLNLLAGASGNIQNQLNGKLAVADTSLMLDHYIARGDTLLMLDPYALNSQVALKENALGNPASNGYVLSSTTGGTRSWVAQPAGMTYPGAGIALSTGSAWSGSIVNSSANWNTAYGWGPHASAGYAPLASPIFTGTPRISTDTVATRAYARANGMLYPGAGIPLSSGTGWTTSIANNSANWNTSYTERRQWDGSATNLVAATGRTSLGATSLGSNLFTMPNPNAETYIRINVDNTVSALSAALFKTNLGLQYVTNESKATMFASPTFTGTTTIPSPFTLGSTSVTSTGTQINYLSGASGITGSGSLVLSGSPVFTGTMTLSQNISLLSGSQMSWAAGDVNLTHTANQLTLSGGNFSLGTGSFYLSGDIATTGTRAAKGWLTNLEITNTPTINGTSMASIFASTASPTFTGTVILPAATSIGSVSSTEITHISGVTSPIQTQLTGKEPALGNPAVSGYILSSTTAGVRSWIAPGSGGGMVYPAAGIAVSTGSAWGTSITDNSTNWNTGYTERRYWDGGATGLVPVTARTSLGATTIGSNLFTLTNPSAIRYLRTNADNTITALTAAQVKTDLALAAADVGLGNVTNESKVTMFNNPTFTGAVTVPSPFTLGITSVTTTGTQLNYLNAANGTTGTGSLVFSASPTFTGTVSGTFSGSLTGNASTVTGFTRNAGTLTLSGGHGLTVTTTGTTSVTMPTTGTLATTANLTAYALLASPTFTGTVTLPSTTSIGNASSTEIGYIDGLNGTAASRQNIKDSLDQALANAVEVIALADSTWSIGKAEGSYVTGMDWENGNTAPMVRGVQALGGTMKALPILGYNPTVAHTLADATPVGLAFYIPKEVTITGAAWIQQAPGDYTAADYNGFALYSVSGTTYTLVGSTTNDGNIWKATAQTIGTKAFSSPLTLTPGAYYLVSFYNQSAQVAPPVVYHFPNMVNAVLLKIAGDNPLAWLDYTVNTPPSSITLATVYTQVEPPVYWLY